MGGGSMVEVEGRIGFGGTVPDESGEGAVNVASFLAWVRPLSAMEKRSWL